MGLVWATSSVRDNDFGPRLNRIAAESNGAVCLLWHEEVATVAYAYPRVGVFGHTLASAGNAGEIITRVLESCGYVVARGGSTRHRSRRRQAVLLDLIRHMRENDRVIYGLTVDGSNGPAYQMKLGGVAIARACGKPVVLVRTWFRRSWRAPTWDRTAIPLPFNEIVYQLRGPYEVPPDADGDEGLERFRADLEADLRRLAAESYEELGQRPPALLL